jgi:hypothetical protein
MQLKYLSVCAMMLMALGSAAPAENSVVEASAAEPEEVEFTPDTCCQLPPAPYKICCTRLCTQCTSKGCSVRIYQIALLCIYELMSITRPSPTAKAMETTIPYPRPSSRELQIADFVASVAASTDRRVLVVESSLQMVEACGD